jgi:hypothetical protein
VPIHTPLDLQPTQPGNRHASRAFTAVVVLGFLGIAGSVGARSSWAQGDYPPVTAADIPKLKLIHYFDTGNKYHPVDFEWTFTNSRFVIRKGKGPIAADLLAKLLPAGASAERIEGKWTLRNVNGMGLMIVFNEIQGDGKAGRAEAGYTIYRTAPSVIRFDTPQYVFERMR